ncbi:cyclin N-terminal domain-containing protein 1-like [Parasteatoda tepidariorum]|uniref:cyclin N-terminal domain-containing protein 1-like n=1 Tax=Parasteatoda tepidariorum TaxID=114398 RepID=UPI0039BC2D3B
MHIMSLRRLEDGIQNLRFVSNELLEDWLFDLLKKNQERVSAATTLEYLWSQEVVEFIFNICSSFKLKSDVKYTALEIYERFVGNHVLELYRTVKNSRNSRTPLVWEDIKARIGEQVILRVITSVQLASKLNSHYNHITPDQVFQFLVNSGKSYSKSGIFNSELRLMRSLNYKVNVTTPSIYVNTLLCVLFTNDPSLEDILFTTSVKTLDFVYLNRTRVYNHLYESITGLSVANSVQDNEIFLKIKADYMLLAGSIIATAAYMVMKDKWNKLLEQLHQVTRILKRDIKNFSIVIIDVMTEFLKE